MSNQLQQQSLLDILKRGLEGLKLMLPETTQAKLIAYVELLARWNAIHNLTSVRDPKEMVSRHILDSLTVLPFLSVEHQGNSTPPKICDVGTGAGLPGLVLALCKPDIDFVLLDSNQKKINFVQQAILSLQLTNAKALCCRIEQYHPEVPFDWVISRAFASLSDFLQLTHHLSSLQGTWLAMKGILTQEELAALPKGYTIEKIEPLVIPNVTSERCLVVIRKFGVS